MEAISCKIKGVAKIFFHIISFYFVIQVFIVLPIAAAVGSLIILKTFKPAVGRRKNDLV